MSAVKENQEIFNIFQNVFTNEDHFMAKASCEDLAGFTVGLLQFSLDTLNKIQQEKAGMTGTVRNFSVKFAGKEVNDEALKRIFIQSQNLTQNIVNQKQRIEQAYENVKETIDSGRISSTPTASRPQSSTSLSRKAAETPKHRFTPMLGFREKSQSLKENGSDDT
jgi:hypothetical protein